MVASWSPGNEDKNSSLNFSMKTSNPTLIQLAGPFYFEITLYLEDRWTLNKYLLFLQPEQTTEDTNETAEPEKPQKASLKSMFCVWKWLIITKIYTYLVYLFTFHLVFQKNQAMCCSSLSPLTSASLQMTPMTSTQILNELSLHTVSWSCACVHVIWWLCRLSHTCWCKGSLSDRQSWFRVTVWKALPGWMVSGPASNFECGRPDKD